jgi:hypothetical protein
MIWRYGSFSSLTVERARGLPEGTETAFGNCDLRSYGFAGVASLLLGWHFHHSPDLNYRADSGGRSSPRRSGGIGSIGRAAAPYVRNALARLAETIRAQSSSAHRWSKRIGASSCGLSQSTPLRQAARCWFNRSLLVSDPCRRKLCIERDKFAW